MSVDEITIACLGLLVAGLVKGLTGIGFSTAALPFLALAFGLKPAMALVTLPAIASNLAVFAGAGSNGAALRRFWPFYAASVPGIVAGTFAVGIVDTGVAVQLLVLATLAYVGIALARPDLHLSPAAERRLKIPAGWLTGLLTGLTGSQIMPLMPYIMALRLAPDEQVQAVNLAVSLAAAALVVALAVAGIMTAELMAVSALGIVPAIAGVAAGNRLRQRLSPAAFRHLALATLTLVALSLQGRVGAVPHEGCTAAAALVALAARGSFRPIASPPSE